VPPFGAVIFAVGLAARAAPEGLICVPPSALPVAAAL